MSMRLRDSQPGIRALTATLTCALVCLAAGSEAVSGGGSLAIGSNPTGATVYVEGKLVGQTPLTVDRLVAREYRVKVAKEGYLENSRLVPVGVGQEAAVEIHLTPGRPGVNREAGDQPGSVHAGRAKKGGSARKVLLFAGGLAAAGGATLLLLPKNHAPVVTGTRATPEVALQGVTPVTFAAVAANDPDDDPLTYTWDFGDGGTGSGPTPVHTYATTGTFPVRVTLSDGRKSTTASGSVVVKSMSGEWAGSFNVGNRFTFKLTQAGVNLSGSFEMVWYNAECLTDGEAITSAKVWAPRHVSLNVRIPTTCYGNYSHLGARVRLVQFDCDLDATMDACTGPWNEAGYGITWNPTMARR